MEKLNIENVSESLTRAVDHFVKELAEKYSALALAALTSFSTFVFKGEESVVPENAKPVQYLPDEVAVLRKRTRQEEGDFRD